MKRNDTQTQGTNMTTITSRELQALGVHRSLQQAHKTVPFGVVINGQPFRLTQDDKGRWSKEPA